MKLIEARQQFISSWGAFGTHWGINRTMAQIHALLLISPDPLTQDDIMEQLNISRGNTNMNIRELINWGLMSSRACICAIVLLMPQWVPKAPQLLMNCCLASISFIFQSYEVDFEFSRNIESLSVEHHSLNCIGLIEE